MPNEYYDHSTFPSTGSSGSSASMRAELELIEAGFAKLPSLSGNAGKLVVVNPGATGLDVTAQPLTLSGPLIKAGSHSLTLTTTADSVVTFPTTGTLSTLAGAEILSNKTITSPIMGGAWAILTTTQTGHGIGTAAVAGAGMALSLTATGPGSGIARGFYCLSTITGGVSDDIRCVHLSSAITKAASGTHADVDGVNIGVPTIAGAATATRASTLRINGPPASGATNLYAMRVDSGTSFFGGLVDLSGAAAGQIKFPAAQNASADANTLDDYEEGVWTPSLGGTATYTNRGASYTKIGRLVFVDFLIDINAIGTGSHHTISGLPFTITNSTSISMGAIALSGSENNVVSAIIQANPNTTTLTVLSLTAAGASFSSNNVLTSGTAITGSICYRV